MKTTLTFLLCLCCSAFLMAQKAPIKWGKVDQSDLKLKICDIDPEADAMVLADYGNLYFDLSSGEILYKMDRHIRVKLFKKSAFDFGDIMIPYYSYSKKERISGIKAQVILPNGEKISVNKKDIFKEDYNEYWSDMKFAFPGLEEGCIIEYKYTKESDQIFFLEDWYFQSNIPTRLSEFRTNIPEWFNYVTFNQGTTPKTEKKEISRNLSVPRYTNTDVVNNITRSAQKGRQMLSAQIVVTRYYLENVPALTNENFITTMQDYYSKLSLQLQYIQYPNSPYQNVTSNWIDIAKDLETSYSFGEQINKKRHTKKLRAAVKDKMDAAKNEQEKVGILYSFISQNVVWNEDYGTSSNSLDEVFEEKSATSGELNLMFIALCRQYKIAAYPVLISTRTHGRPLQHYPKLDQFNHVLAMVETGGKEILFDVGSPTRDPGLLRMNSLNYQGWLVDGEKSEWINLPSSSDVEITLAKLNLDEAGGLSGTIKTNYKGYCAMDNRVKYLRNKEEDHKNIREKWEDVFPDIEINNISFENPEDVSKALQCNIELNIPQAAQTSEAFIYLSPMLNLGYDENPLKLEERTYPVDFPKKFKDQYVLNLSIPEGYVVDELPETISLVMEGNGGTFKFLVSQTENTIQIINKVAISKMHFPAAEYPALKNFFDLIVEKHGEQIVLKKI